jgi:hypothetical protein
MSEQRIFGRTWAEIQKLQQRQSIAQPVDTSRQGDYGADPLDNGMFRMVPSGDIVDYAERNRRLGPNG